MVSRHKIREIATSNKARKSETTQLNFRGTMGCCVTKNRHPPSKPIVAIIGSTGYVGKCLTQTFLDALENGRLKELRILTPLDKIDNELILSYVASGAIAVIVPNYEDAPAMAEVLLGTDVLVSALGAKGQNMEKIKNAVLQALVLADVKVYFPSEFGTNHYKLPKYNHPVFDGKKSHFKDAQGLGLNPIRILNGNIVESCFGKWFGLDCKTGDWTVVESGADIPCAMTTERDLARFTLEAVLLAHSDISKCPNELEVYSDIRTLREYAKAFDKVSGGEIKINTVPLDAFMVEYNKDNDKDFTKLIMIMFAEGAYDYSNATGNELLNPQESVWKLEKIEEYAQKTNGVPGNDLE